MRPTTKKAAGGLETTTATALHSAIDSIAPCTSPASPEIRLTALLLTQGYSKTGVTRVIGVTALIHKEFFCNPATFSEVTGVTKRGYSGRFGRVRGAAVTRCDRIHATPEMGPVRKNIVSGTEAQTHALSWVFSRLEFKGELKFQLTYGFGRDGRSGNARRMAVPMFLTSRPPYARKNADGGLQSCTGAEFMTTVNTTTPKMGRLTLGTKPAPSPATLARRLAIDAALSAALCLVRTTDTQHGIQAATGRAIRAVSMLKQACAEATTTHAGRV